MVKLDICDFFPDNIYHPERVSMAQKQLVAWDSPVNFIQLCTVAAVSISHDPLSCLAMDGKVAAYL